MKNFIVFCLLSFSVCSVSFSSDVYTVRTESFKLVVSEAKDALAVKIYNVTDTSLNLIGTAEDIINYLYSDRMDMQIKNSQIYRLEVESQIAINQSKTEILQYFCRAVGLDIEYESIEQTNYVLSYITEDDRCEAQLLESDNSSVVLDIDFKKRLFLRGLSLEETVESLNESLEVTVFEAGESNLAALPKMYFNKGKIKDDPVAYLQLKGFTTVEAVRIIKTPILVY